MMSHSLPSCSVTLNLLSSSAPCVGWEKGHRMAVYRMPLNTLGVGCWVVSDAFTELLEHASVLSERFPLICVVSQKVWVPGPTVEVCDRLWHPWAVSTAQYHPHGLQFWNIWWRVSEKLPEKYSTLGLVNMKHSIITKPMCVCIHTCMSTVCVWSCGCVYTCM